MKICFVTTDFVELGKPQGGLPNYLYRVSKGLMQRGHEITVITLSDRNEYKVIEKIKVYRCSTSGIMEFDNLYASFFCGWIEKSYILNRKLTEVNRKEKFDIVQYTNLHGVSMFCPKNIVGVLRLSSYAKEYFKSFQSYNKGFVHLMAWVERVSSRRMRGIFAPSRVMAEAFSKDIKRKVAVIETPYEPDIQESQWDYSVYDYRLKHKKYILFFGKDIYEEKGILVIGQMIQRFLTEHPEYTWVFVGNDRKQLMKNIMQKAGACRKQLIHINALKHEQLFPIIIHAEAVILPSLMENFSNACLESMYLHKIVIGTNGTSFEQLIEDGKSGFLCEPGDAQSLLFKIESALAMTDAEKISMQERAYQRIRRLRMEIGVQHLERFYQYILNNDMKERKRA